MTIRITLILLLSLPTSFMAAFAQDDPPANDQVLRALVDELGRSMTLKLENLDTPYFVEYVVDDSDTYRVSASFGAIVTSDQSRSRRLNSQVRVGTYQLDSTNFTAGGGGGGRFRGGGGGGPRRGGGGSGSAVLPIEDDYTAIRQAIWAATDRDYKAALETLSQKRAYMQDRQADDRPDDFSRQDPVRVIEAPMVRSFDQPKWERILRQLSERFLEGTRIQQADVDLQFSVANRYLVNSEGTRQRTGQSRVLLSVTASGQTDNGDRLSDGERFFAEAPEGLPGLEALELAVDALVARLEGALGAPELGEYTGPVLFDGLAAAQMFQALLAPGLAGRPDQVGERRRRSSEDENLAKQLGRRILPSTFSLFDDPRAELFEQTLLAGHYLIDDEGVLAERVPVVERGKLVGLAMSRTPTREFVQSNGHGRGSRGASSASIGCLYVETAEGLAEAELRQALIEAAREQDLKYGIRIASIASGGSATGLLAQFARAQGGGPSLPDPLLIYKVFVDDGHEEQVRGVEFGDLDLGALKEIVEAGSTRTVHNHFGGLRSAAPQSVIAPSVLFEELDLYRIEQESERKPILDPPASRSKSGR